MSKSYADEFLEAAGLNFKPRNPRSFFPTIAAGKEAKEAKRRKKKLDLALPQVEEKTRKRL